jgi:multicomponent Na+:H+ antiporter subunit C
MMSLLLALTIGVLFGCGLNLLMSFHLLRMIFGFLILSQAANLFLFAVGGITYGRTPLIPDTAQSLRDSPEPLSQALILTAIVIGFAATAFLVVLVRQTASAYQTVNSEKMNEAES